MAVAPTRSFGSGALAAIATIGMRPCSGALIVLAFALSQGMLLAGVASAFAMALGTGITVATIAAIAITAKGLAMKMAGPESRASYVLHRSVEIGGALFVLLTGLILLTAAVGFGAGH